MAKPLYSIGQRVCVTGREEDIRVVSAVYRVEIWWYYKLSEMSDFLVREERVQGVDAPDAPRGAPRPMSQGVREYENTDHDLS